MLMVDPVWLFKEITNEGKFSRTRKTALKRMLFLQYLYVCTLFLFLGLWFFYGARGNSIVEIWIFISICWLLPFLWIEFVFNTDIKDFTVISLSHFALVVEKPSRLLWKIREIQIPIKTIKKIKIDGKSGKFIIQLSNDKQVIIKKSRSYLQNKFFMGRKLEELKNALQTLQIKYEVIYP